MESNLQEQPSLLPFVSHTHTPLNPGLLLVQDPSEISQGTSDVHVITSLSPSKLTELRAFLKSAPKETTIYDI
jgi:hypothetical protein